MIEPNLVIYYLALFILILLSSFFSAAETAFLSFGKHHFQKIAESDERKAQRMSFWFENPSMVLVSVLVGNNIVNISASVLAAALSQRIFHKVSIALVTGVMTFIILIFGEIITKSLAKKHAETVAFDFALPTNFSVPCLHPL